VQSSTAETEKARASDCVVIFDVQKRTCGGRRPGASHGTAARSRRRTHASPALAGSTVSVFFYDVSTVTCGKKRPSPAPSAAVPGVSWTSFASRG